MRLKEIYKEKKQTNKRYRRLNEKYNEQALHYEIMINRLRPDLLAKSQEKPLAPIVRPDVRRVDSNIHQSAKNILIEKGILQDPTQPTVLLDQFTGTVPAPEKADSDTQDTKRFNTIETQTER